MDAVSFVLLAGSELGCRAGGLALVVGFGSVAYFSHRIADALWGQRAATDLIRRRNPLLRDEAESRSLYATFGRWLLFAWGALGAMAGALVVSGLLKCS